MENAGFPHAPTVATTEAVAIPDESDVPTVLDRTRAILARVLSIPPSQVTGDSAVRSLPNADSAAMLESILAIEDHFGIEFPDALVFRVEKVAEIAGVVEELVAARARVAS